MDEHVRRVCRPLVVGWNDFVAGRATLADLSRLAGQARHALDGSTEPLPGTLRVAELELLALSDEGEHPSDEASARRYLKPVFEQIDHSI